MFLLVDTSETNKIHFVIFDEKQIEHKYYSGRNRDILIYIDRLIKIKNLKGIMVVVGAGSFTSTRLACVVANTFAYVLKIPVMAIKKDEIDKIQELIEELKACPAKPGGRRRGQYISATYSGEANITRLKRV